MRSARRYANRLLLRPPVPSRYPLLRVQDILEAISRIQRYTAGMSLETFSADDKTTDAVIRNFIVVPPQRGQRGQRGGIAPVSSQRSTTTSSAKHLTRARLPCSSSTFWLRA